MLNGELSSEELNFNMGGNEEVQKLISLATNLLEHGYTRDEVRKAVAKRFDLSNPVISNELELLCSRYNKDVPSAAKKM